jgi:hypothetical protein
MAAHYCSTRNTELYLNLVSSAWRLKTNGGSREEAALWGEIKTSSKRNDSSDIYHFTAASSLVRLVPVPPTRYSHVASHALEAEINA